MLLWIDTNAKTTQSRGKSPRTSWTRRRPFPGDVAGACLAQFLLPYKHSSISGVGNTPVSSWSGSAYTITSATRLIGAFLAW